MKTSGQSNLTQAASPRHTNGSVVFARLRLDNAVSSKTE